MISNGTMMKVFEITFIIVGIIGFLASVLNWEWYFNLSRKTRFWGRHRALNAIGCAVVVFWAISLLVKGI